MKTIIRQRHTRTIPFTIVILASILTFFLVACTTNENQNQNDPGNEIGYTEESINIDGEAKEGIWQNTGWRAIDQNWLGADYTENDFSGRYKIVWDNEQIYILAEIIDDILMDQTEDGLVQYWNDDCLEVFIDEDASQGDHQYNYNAFAYHIGLDNRVVDIGVDSVAHYYDHVKCVRKTEGNTSIWELSMALYDDTFDRSKENEKVQLEENKKIGFAIAYCDNDQSEQRENFIGSVYVEGEDKNRGWIDAGIFETMHLTKE